ncbi:hypothetical protein X753_21780 [Mesorhizobium sp. LNJC399B00]|uniref:hypothetical protein n=1 Tax=unclassified Mesorhizobium TaxID=325217 RepID=UPI0003CE6715|nr:MULTISPECIES: hypothetical protein [unclassified Mesorhizobium]ESY03907.1 hypothetical protein X753_21780 [Mesorhizobium sp. LNJC399B00]WJI68955.1 hypothetical protein NLY36_29975 [Mesorhizobium sp. C399B]
MTNCETIAFEAAKLALQFGGAMFIAWKAVQWALARYKAEKHWERRLSAYSELVAALGAMSRINGIWELEELDIRAPTAESTDELRARYWAARRRLEETSAVAQLLLSEEVTEILKALEKGLGNVPNRSNSFFEQIQNEWPLIDKANKELIALGRADLGLK